MKKYLLDTNVCIFFLKGKYNLNEKLKKIGIDNCCISEVTLAELKYCAECSDRITEYINMIDDFAKEKAKLRKSGNLIDDFAILIGVAAVANNMILVTENENHLVRISKVKIENWIKR